MNDGYGLSPRVSRSIRIVKALSRAVAVFTLLLTLGVAEMWAEEDIGAGTHGRAKPPIKPTDTAVVITPTISTQDTLYLKHEAVQSGKESNGMNTALWMSLITLILGAGITILTTWLNSKRDLRYRKQEKLDDEIKTTEKDIYYQLIDIKNATTDKQRLVLLEDFNIRLQKARLYIRPSVRAIARDMMVYFFEIATDNQVVRQPEKEEMLLDNYYEIFKQA